MWWYHYTCFNWLLLTTLSLLWCMLLELFRPSLFPLLHTLPCTASFLPRFYLAHHLCHCFITRNMGRHVWSSILCLLARNIFWNNKVLFVLLSLTSCSSHSLIVSVFSLAQTMYSSSSSTSYPSSYLSSIFFYVGLVRAASITSIASLEGLSAVVVKRFVSWHFPHS